MTLLLATLLLSSTSQAEDLLLLGNSYTQYNDLEELVAQLFDAGLGREHSAQRLSSGGLTFAEHLSRVEGSNAAWADQLGDTKATHGWVFLQEQSQIPGFPEHNSYVVDSVAAAAGLNAAAQAHGAQTVFTMTWGRREGDSTNPDRYPDYQTMQDLLTEGYLRYVETTSTTARPTWVAPAGLAFSLAHADTAAATGDALATDGLFWQLYSDDGSHPSMAGSYLTACVIYATVTGNDPTALSVAPAELESDTAAALRDLARRTVFEETDSLHYPWEEGGDSGTPTDGGSASDGGATEDGGSTGDAGSATDGGTGHGGTDGEDESPRKNDDGDEHTCSAVAAPSALGLFALLGLLARRRRR